MRTVNTTIQRPLRRLGRLCALILLTSLAAGCSNDQGLEDLEQFINQARMKKGSVAPLPVFKELKTFTYHAEKERDPFRNWQVEDVADLDAPVNQNGLRPDAKRPREQLEQFPLDALKLRGTLTFDDTRWALIEAPDSIVYKVRRGNYLGKNYGKITDIGINKLMLTEIVSDGLGGWQNREAILSVDDE